MEALYSESIKTNLHHKTVICIEQRFISDYPPINIAHIKRGNIYYCVRSMSFKEETFKQIIKTYEIYNTNL